MWWPSPGKLLWRIQHPVLSTPELSTFQHVHTVIPGLSLRGPVAWMYLCGGPLGLADRWASSPTLPLHATVDYISLLFERLLLLCPAGAVVPLSRDHTSLSLRTGTVGTLLTVPISPSFLDWCSSPLRDCTSPSFQSGTVLPYWTENAPSLHFFWIPLSWERMTVDQIPLCFLLSFLVWKLTHQNLLGILGVIFHKNFTFRSHTSAVCS